MPEWLDQEVRRIRAESRAEIAVTVIEIVTAVVLVTAIICLLFPQ